MMSEGVAVLVVEDNDFVRMQIVKFLQSGGYVPFDASNASDAMNVLNKEGGNIKCALVDVRMEPEDGFDFLSKVDAAGFKLPSILVTGDQNTDILSKGTRAGVSSVLMKPVNKDRLLKMVERAIQTASRTS